MPERFFSYFKSISAVLRPDRRFGNHRPLGGALPRMGLCFFVFLFALASFPVFIPTATAHDTSCHRLPRSQGELICPPPFGGLLVDINGSVTCGPGFCARNSYGKVKCSSVPGGAVDMDAKGDVLCVGGCVDGATSYCVAPQS